MTGVIYKQATPVMKAPGLGYMAALCFGAVLVAWTFPTWAILGIAPPGAPASPDFAQHVVGQRYFLMDPWHWPLLVARQLDAPHGTNIGLTDSLPLLALLLKPFASLLPHGFQAVTIWVVLCWTLQPVAAVFALRSTGERRVLPAIAVAVLASMLPSFLMRLPHAALESHFTLLVMLGLYCRATHGKARGSAWIVCAGLMLPVLLLIHPYLMMMAAALLLAIPLTLLVRRQGHWSLAALVALLSIVGTTALAVLLGYAGRGMAGVGFGVYSMNLFGPVWPDISMLFYGFPPPIDATGGQYEGSQYLGGGIILLCLVVLVVAPKRVADAAVHHAGLVAACVALTAVALSAQVYAGRTLILSLPSPAIMGVVRASGRFFWPVSYTILIGGAALLARSLPRSGPAILVILAALQFVDASALLSQDRKTLLKTVAYPFEVAQVRSAMLGKNRLDIIPRFPCDATLSAISAMMQVIWIGSETGIPTDTMYTARPMPPLFCNAQEQAAAPLATGDVRVLLPGHADLLRLVPDGASLCKPAGDFEICSRPAN